MTTPAGRPVPHQQLRIGDRERQEFVQALGEHHAAGRLTTAELDERIAAAWHARTQSDLDALVQDLPGVRLPAPPASPRTGPSTGAVLGLATHLGGSLLVIGVLWLVWALTWTGYPWPVWPTVAIGLGVVVHARAVRAIPASPLWRCGQHNWGRHPLGQGTR